MLLFLYLPSGCFPDFYCLGRLAKTVSLSLWFLIENITGPILVLRWRLICRNALLWRLQTDGVVCSTAVSLSSSQEHDRGILPGTWLAFWSERNKSPTNLFTAFISSARHGTFFSPISEAHVASLSSILTSVSNTSSTIYAFSRRGRFIVSVLEISVRL